MVAFGAATLITLLLLQIRGLSSCPDECSCYRNRFTWSVTVECREGGLRTIPNQIPSNVNEVDLTNNFIHEVPSGSFQELTAMNALKLSGNFIRDVAPDSLSDLTNLQELDLSSNLIEDISFLVMGRMPSLTELWLDRNPISSIPPGAFDSLSLLRTLALAKTNLRNLTDARLRGQSIFLRHTPLKLIGNNAFARPSEVYNLNLNDCEFEILSPIGNLTSLAYLQVQHNHITRVEPSTFDFLPSIQELDLTGNQISDVTPFQNIFQLQVLHLGENIISFLPSDAFQGLPALETLDVRFNRLSTLSLSLLDFESVLLNGNQLVDIFTLGSQSTTLIQLSENPSLTNISTYGMSNLENLYFSGCSVDVIELVDKRTGLPFSPELVNVFGNDNKFRSLSHFYNHSKLRDLRLHNNNINEIGEFGLSGLPALRNIYLGNNNLTEFPGFPHLPALTILDLTNNYINSLSTESFSNLPALTKLILTGNNIHEIPIFPNLPHLTELHLDDNPVDVVQENPFENIESLETVAMDDCHLSTLASIGRSSSLQLLKVAHNQINDITSETFTNLPNLQTLLMPHNLVTSIPELLQVDSLRTLNVSHNMLSEIDLLAFVYGGNILNIDVSYNLLTSFEFIVTVPSLTTLMADHNEIQGLPDPFGIPPSLRFLSLEGNRISVLNPYDFAVAEKLNTLNLNNNKIVHIPANIFEFCEDLTSLRLSGNPIQSLDPNSFYGLSSMQFFLLLNVPLQQLPDGLFDNSPLLRYVDLANVSALRNDYSASIPNTIRLNIDNNGFTVFPNITAPGVTYVFANHNELSHFPSQILTRYLYLNLLSLNSNKIISIQDEDLENVRKVRVLRMDDNDISYVSPRILTIAYSLEELSIRNNKLVQFDIPETILRNIVGFSAYIDIHFSGNPWRCDCNIESVATWLKHKGSEMPSLCSSPGDMSGRDVMTLTTSQLKCSSGPDPVVVRVTCSVAANFSGNITWVLPSGEEVLTLGNTLDVTIIDHNDTVQTPVVVNHTVSSDTGNYVCVVGMEWLPDYEIVTETVEEFVTDVVTEIIDVHQGNENEATDTNELFTFMIYEGSGFGGERNVNPDDLGPPYGEAGDEYEGEVSDYDDDNHTDLETRTPTPVITEKPTAISRSSRIAPFTAILVLTVIVFLLK